MCGKRGEFGVGDRYESHEYFNLLILMRFVSLDDQEMSESIMADSEDVSVEEAPEENETPILVPWRSPPASPSSTVVEEIGGPVVSGQRARRRSGLPPGIYHHYHPYLHSTHSRLRRVTAWEDFARDVRLGRTEPSLRRSSSSVKSRRSSGSSESGPLEYPDADLSDTPRYRPS